MDEYELDDWFHTAKVTCEVLVANMVNPDMMNHIFFSHYVKVTAESIIKILIRVKNLYFAREQALVILK